MKKFLYDTFADKWLNEKGTIWVFSDPHFNDPEMVYLRKNYIGDEEQIKKLNKKIGKYDTLICLGDVGDVGFVKKLKGYKILIMGNHDKGASNYKRLPNPHLGVPYVTEDKISKLPEEIQRLKNYIVDNQLFDEVYEGPVIVNDRLILSHEPIEELPKYMFNIHGHDHSNWFTSPQHMNVCVENIDYTPVNLINLLKNGLLKDIDNIHRLTIDKATEKSIKKKSKK